MKISEPVSRPQPKSETPKVEAPRPQPATARPANAAREQFVPARPAAAPVSLPARPATTQGDAQVLDAASSQPNLFLQQLGELKAARGAAPAEAGAPAPAQTGSTPPLQGEDLESAQEAIMLASDSQDATAVADWLEQHPDPKQQEAFMDLLFENPYVSGHVLNSTQRLDEDQKNLIANSLERAFESGAVTADEFKAGIQGGGIGPSAIDTHEGIGDIVRRTHDEALTTAFVEREMELFAAHDDNVDAYRAYGAATALSGLSPAALQRFMQSHPDQMTQLSEGLGYDGGYGYTQSSDALGQLLKTASRIQPPTAESLRLFDQNIDNIGENPTSRAGAAEFMRRNVDEVLAHYQDDSGSLTLDGQSKLSTLFAQTLFSEPSFDGQERYRDALLQKMGQLSSALETQANANPPSIESQRQARLLGSLIGTIEGGFQKAVDELGQKNEAIDGFVDFMFKAADFIPNLPFPGGGLIKDKGIEALKDWVKDSLHHKPKDADEAIPFHESFAQGIDNPALRSYYDSARADAFINVARGLTD